MARFAAGFSGLVLSVGIVSIAAAAAASTGVCDSNPPTSSQACIDQIQAGATVVNDIFKDANGLTATQLPVFGKLFNNWPGCDNTTFDGCSGVSNAPYDCPSGTSYTCTGLPNTIANATDFLSAPDHKWWHPCRLVDHTLVNGCPNHATSNCVQDGDTSGFYPWEGLVFDLGGPANKVAIFAQNDHGPQPCESIEYVVYLTDNPMSQEAIEDPATQGTDPQKWNRAVLQKIFTWGWFNTRSPSPGNACGDTADYAVEDDSFVQLHGLPCGITFRYASIVTGYDGKEFPACAYYSSEGEVDAVAGITEQGSGVCPDDDKDGFVDCNCTGAPSPCDCNDADPSVHPGAPEPCDSTIDLNCDGVPGACPAGLSCYQSLCLPSCKSGEIGGCPIGATCESTTVGLLCVPSDCTTGGCPPGAVCDPTTKTCKPACDGVVCPYGQTCQDGKCIDPCATMKCPAPKQCVLGQCTVPCTCFAANVACTASQACDTTSGQCVPTACQGKSCGAGEHCDDTGNCVGLCDGVTCPQGQKCDAIKGCVAMCDGVSCPTGQSCDPTTGTCVDQGCQPACNLPTVCVAGKCVFPDAGSGGSGATSGDAGPDASAGSGGSVKGGTQGSGDTGGCGCEAPGSGRSLPAVLLMALAGAAWASRRRPRR